MSKRIPVVGDWIKLKSWTSFYRVEKIQSETLYLSMFGVGLEDYSINSNWEFRKITPLPLYSEEQAASFLREKGYKVKEPPEPLSGEVIVFEVCNGKIFYSSRKDWERHHNHYGNKILAVLNWTEGEGL